MQAADHAPSLQKRRREEHEADWRKWGAEGNNVGALGQKINKIWANKGGNYGVLGHEIQRTYRMEGKWRPHHGDQEAQWPVRGDMEEGPSQDNDTKSANGGGDLAKKLWGGDPEGEQNDDERTWRTHRRDTEKGPRSIKYRAHKGDMRGRLREQISEIRRNPLNRCENKDGLRNEDNSGAFGANGNQNPSVTVDNEHQGTDCRATPDLPAGAAALCTLYYIRLHRERRIRELERRRRWFLFRRARARERLRFTVLWTLEHLTSGDVSTEPSSVEERDLLGERLWSTEPPSPLWDSVINKTISNFDWLESFRMSKATFDYLCDQLRPAIEQMGNSMCWAIPAEIKLAMALWCLGSSCDYISTEEIFGVSGSAICTIVRDVCEALVSVLTPRFVCIPHGNVLQDTLQGFERHHGIPQLAGVVGTFHVPIQAPDERSRLYFNTKGWHSVVLQAVVNSDLCFWDLNIGCPGGFSDSQVLLTSELYEWAREGTLFPKTTRIVNGVEVPIHLLGSRSHPLLPWLITPFGEEKCPRYLQKNKEFSSALGVAQAAFGRLKSRWRCLVKCGDTDLSFLPTLIAACCTLHNICETRRDPFEEHWYEEAIEEEYEQPSESEEEEDKDAEMMAKRIRAALANAFRT